MNFYIVVVTVFLQIFPSSAMAFGTSGDGGCCGGSGGDVWYQNTIKNLAAALDEDVDEAKSVFDWMVKRRYSELYLIRESEVPCQLFNGCKSLGNPLIKKIADAAMKYQEFDVRVEKEWWDSIQKLVLGFIALSGLGLGLANRYRPRQ